MKDDSLDDTGTRKPDAVPYRIDSKPLSKPDAIKALAQSKADGSYCNACERVMPLSGCHICNDKIAKLGRVDTDRIDSVYHKEVWNAAIEACFEAIASRCAISQEIFEAVRKLKK